MDLHTGQTNAYVNAGGPVGMVETRGAFQGPGEPNPGWFLIGSLLKWFLTKSPHKLSRICHPLYPP